MLLYQKGNPAHYKQKPRKKIHMRIMTSVCETNGKNCMIFVGIARSKSSVLPTVPFFTKHEGGRAERPIWQRFPEHAQLMRLPL